ncbi:MAG: Glycos transf 1 protein [Magnetococcales bacterium]|nr:Glycos transf 1 protein [Magnetococcales bacterium]
MIPDVWKNPSRYVEGAGMTQAGTDRPVAVSFLATFLSPEMLHVYRQVTSLRHFDMWVITRSRKHPELFPYPNLITLKKSPWRFVARAWHRLARRRVPLSAWETRQMLAAVQRLQAHVVHVYLGTEAVRALPYLRQEHRPKVVSFHGADLSDHLKPEEFDQLLAATDLFLVRSDSLKRALLERGCPEQRIRMNRTGVPMPESFTPRIPPQYSAQRPLRLLQACRFVEKKGLDVTIQALAQVRERGVAAMLTLMGSGPREKALRQLVKDLNLESQVQFPGFVDNQTLLQGLPHYDIFLHPSRMTSGGDREGIPNALLEAMAWGIPSIATRHSGIPEVIADGINGILIEESSPQSLAQAIIRMATDPRLSVKISQGGHDTIAQRFTIARCVESLEESYRFAITLARSRNSP